MKITFIWLRWTGDYGLISGYFARKSGGIVMPLNLTLLASPVLQQLQLYIHQRQHQSNFLQHQH